MANIWNNLKGRRKCMRKHFKTTFFAQYPLFWKFAFTVCAKEFISYQKYLITKVFKTFSAFGGDRINMEKLIFISHFLFLKNNKVISEHSEFLSSLFNIAYWSILYIWSHDVCKYVQYTTRIALFSKDCFFSGHSSAQKNEYQSGVFSSNQLSVCYHAIISFTILQYYSIGKDGKKGGKFIF